MLDLSIMKIRSQSINSLMLLTFIILSHWLIAEQLLPLYSDKKLKQIKQQYGSSIAQRLPLWKAFVEKNQNQSERDKLTLTNDYFNDQLRWTDDQQLWNKKDYWATPIETLIKNAGDCEDFTIIKYFTLLALGVPIEHLKLSYVKALDYNQAHMVLTYAQSKRDIPLVLDNINKKILPASQRSDLKPVYSFNGEGMWLQKKRSLGKRVGNSSRIRLWTELNSRMQKELL